MLRGFLVLAVLLFTGFVSGHVTIARPTHTSVTLERPIVLETEQVVELPELVSSRESADLSLEEQEELARDLREVIEAVKEGSRLYFALAQYDLWLEALKTGKMRLSSQDFRADFNDLVGYMREVDATTEQVVWRLEKLLEVVKAKNFAEDDIKWLEGEVEHEQNVVSLADRRAR